MKFGQRGIPSGCTLRWLGPAAALLVFGLGLVGCELIRFGPAPTQTPLPPTSSPTPTLTATPTPWPSSTPSFTPTPTASATPTLTPTATPTAPWCGPIATASPAGVATQETPLTQGILRVSYLEHGNLWVWEEGGAPRQISSSGDITEQRLSPDGQRIAYLRRVGEARVELWAVDGSGENPRLLVDSAAFAGMRSAMRTERRRAGIVPYGLAWLPGRHVLAFNTRPLFPEERDFVPDDLWLVNADNLYLSNLLPAGQGGAFSYSPDGRTIALLTPSRLDLVNADGSNRRPDVLPGYHSTGTGLEEVFPKPAWAPDSRSFKIALPAPENAQDPIPRVDIWELPLPGFIESLDRTIQGFPSSVVFSPDLLFSAYWRWSDPQAAGREIHLAGVIQATATPTGQATPEVTPTPDPSAADYLYSAGPPLEFLGWSPDSRSFALWDSQAHRLYAGGICAVPTLLADGLPSLGLLYWQDAQTVLFVTGTEGAWQLRRVTSGQPAQILLELGASAGFDFALLPEK